ncbi:hypothetical protein ACJZ2D_008562 [Fusarium nematophilum]
MFPFCFSDPARRLLPFNMKSRTKSQQSTRLKVSTACTECRSSKQKCDGKQPTCRRCELKEKQCRYQTQEDKRRIPLKRALSIFLRRTHQLELFITALGLTPPPVPAEDETIFRKLSPALRTHLRTQPSVSTDQSNPAGREPNLSWGPIDDALSSPCHSESNIGPKIEAKHVEDVVETEAAPSIAMMDPTIGPPLSINGQQPLGVEGNGVLGSVPLPLDWIDFNCATGLNTLSPERHIDIHPMHGVPRNTGHLRGTITTAYEYEFAGDEEELVLQLSNHMGQLHLMEDGQSRFYGATSNFNLAKWKTSAELGGQSPDKHQFGASTARDSNALEPSIDATLENLYFCWQNPAFYAIDRAMYKLGKKQWQASQQSSTFYSPLLANAICTFAALFYYPRRRTEQLALVYGKTARALLELELDCPKVATVQALVILSTFEAASNRDARGWLYCGMAMRLAFDLGLHVDMQPYVLRGDMTKEEAKARGTAFWGCYIVDHLWGFYLGRPFHTNSGNITVQKPWADPSDVASLWSPCGQDEGDEADKSTGTLGHVDLVSQQWVLLCESMDALGNMMYGCNSVSRPELALVAENTLAGLDLWKHALPSELHVDLDDTSASPLPHLILLHMQYYQIMIYIHRPFLSGGGLPPSAAHPSPLGNSRAICIDSAKAISKLVRIYERTYTLRRINIQAVSIIFSASLLLVFASITATPEIEDEDLATHLEVCSHALAEIGEYYENSSRSLDLLLKIKRDWKARIVSGGSLLAKRRRSQGIVDGFPHKQSRLDRRVAPSSSQGTINCGGSVGLFGSYDDPSLNFPLFDSVDWRYAIDDHPERWATDAESTQRE